MTSIVELYFWNPMIWTLLGIVVLLWSIVGICWIVDKTRERKLEKLVINIIITILIIMAVIFSCMIVFNAQAEAWKQTNNYCDTKYGINNYTMVDITGTEEAIKDYGRFYIGQVWKCEQCSKEKK